MYDMERYEIPEAFGKVEWIMSARLVFFYLFRHLENREGQSVQGGLDPCHYSIITCTHALRGTMLGVESP